MYDLFTGQLSAPNPNNNTSPPFELSHYLGYMGMCLCFPPWLIAARSMQQALTHLRNPSFHINAVENSRFGEAGDEVKIELSRTDQNEVLIAFRLSSSPHHLIISFRKERSR